MLLFCRFCLTFINNKLFNLLSCPFYSFLLLFLGEKNVVTLSDPNQFTSLPTITVPGYWRDKVGINLFFYCQQIAQPDQKHICLSMLSYFFYYVLLSLQINLKDKKKKLGRLDDVFQDRILNRQNQIVIDFALFIGFIFRIENTIKYIIIFLLKLTDCCKAKIHPASDI